MALIQKVNIHQNNGMASLARRFPSASANIFHKNGRKPVENGKRQLLKV